MRAPMEWMRDAIDRLEKLRVVTDASEQVIDYRLTHFVHALSVGLPGHELLDRARSEIDQVQRHAPVAHDDINTQLETEIERLRSAREPAEWTETPIYAAPSGHPYATRQAVIEPIMTNPDAVMQVPESEHDPVHDADRFLWGYFTGYVPAPRETPGGDHALAAVLGAITHNDPGALRRMVEWDPRPTEQWEKGAPVLHFPGRRPFTTSPLLHHVQDPASTEWDQAALWPAPPVQPRMRPAGIVADTISDEAPNTGISYIAKGYAACLSLQEHPLYLRPDETPLPARVQEAMTFLTGRPTTWEHPRLELDDDALADRLNATEVVACSVQLTPDEAYDLGVYSGAHAYAVIGAERGRVAFHHPRGGRLALSLADFRDVFADIICGTPTGPSTRGPAPTPPQMDNLAAHLDR